MVPPAPPELTNDAPGVQVDALDLSVRLEGTAVLDGVRLSVASGRWIGLLGPNGAGKTTLLRSIAGLVPYDGQLRVSGLEVRNWERRRLARRLAFVRQSVSLAFDFRVEDLVILGRSPHKRWLAGYDGTDRALCEDALSRLDLLGFARRSIHSLSAGEQQRVFLAQALVQQPDLLLLDEPTAHLDIHHQFDFLEHVRNFVRSGHTVIAAFHDLELAAQYVDEMIILDHGAVAASGPPSEALTPEMIARVFRVDASVSIGSDGINGIRYHGNLKAEAPGPGAKKPRQMDRRTISS